VNDLLLSFIVVQMFLDIGFLLLFWRIVRLLAPEAR